jgi:hypothetical protein
VDGISTDVVFEVFDSGGKWDFLFGKTLLEGFKAIHDYESDIVTVHGAGGKAMLQNQAHIAIQPQCQPKSAPPICVVTDETYQNGDEEFSEVNVSALKNDTALFTRKKWPHKPERVQELLHLITIGDDLSTEEKCKVQELVSSFADVFAL